MLVKSIDTAADGWFDTGDHPVLAAARRDRLGAARTGFEMGIPFNELNRAFDLGFKPLPWANKGYVPSTMQAAGESAPPSNPKPNNQPKAQPDVFSRLAAALSVNGKHQ